MVDILLLNAILYLLTFLYVVYKNKELNIYVLIWLLNTIIAVSGFFCVKNGLYYSHDKELGTNLSIVPYFFVYISIHLLSYPLKKLEFRKVKIDGLCRIPFVNVFVVFSLFIFAALSVLRGGEAFIASQLGFGEAYAAGHSEGEGLIEYSDPLLKAISVWGATYCELFMPIIVFYYLSRWKNKIGNNFMIFLGIILAFLPFILGPLSHGSKGGLFFAAFDILFFYLYAKYLLNKKTKRIITSFGIVMAILLLIAAYFIDEGRIEQRKSDSTAYETLLTYLGEPMPNVGFFYYDKIREHPMGRRFYPEFFGNRNENQFSSEKDFQEYWVAKTGADVQMFKTFWGDCYIEFSIFGALMYIIFLVALWKLFVFNKCPKVYMMPLVFFYYHFFLIYGVFGHGFTGFRKHQMLVYCIIICWLLHFVVKSRYIKNEITS